MIRGTTAQFRFKLPCPKSEIEWATIKIWQSNNPNPLLPIIKRHTDCSLPDTEKEICITLTAEETSRFSDKYKAKVQIRACKITGIVFGCSPKLIEVRPMDDEIIKENEIPEADNNGIITFDGGEIIS